MDRIFEGNGLGKGKDGVSLLTHGELSRIDLTRSAFIMALTRYINGDNCTTKRSKYAQQNCQNLHNKLLEKCTIYIAKLKKICYSKKEGE